MGKKKLDLNSNKLSKSIESAVDWLVKSGIQNTKSHKKGSVNAWYDIKRKNIHLSILR